ncbi:MAG: hypothetical protein ABIP61_04085 [Burkholderiaceae bacterium]
MIGVVGYGVVMALVHRRVGASMTVAGIGAGLVGWLATPLMPMAGAGLFGMSLGIMAPLMTRVLHLIFGAVLGWTCAKLVSSAPQPVIRPQPARP